MQIVDSLIFLTWCTGEQEGPTGNLVFLYSMRIEIVDSRPSYVYPCQIYDVKIVGVYYTEIYSAGRFEGCSIMMIKGILMCVKHEEAIEKYRLLTIYPTIQHDAENPGLNYKICAITGGSYCPAPARIVTVVEPEEKFRNLEPYTLPP